MRMLIQRMRWRAPRGAWGTAAVVGRTVSCWLSFTARERRVCVDATGVGLVVVVVAAAVVVVVVLGALLRRAGGRPPDFDADPEDAMARSPRRVGDCGNEVGRTPPWSWAAATAFVWSFSFSVGERRVCVDATGVESVVVVAAAAPPTFLDEQLLAVSSGWPPPPGVIVRLLGRGGTLLAWRARSLRLLLLLLGGAVVRSSSSCCCGGGRGSRRTVRRLAARRRATRTPPWRRRRQRGRGSRRARRGRWRRRWHGRASVGDAHGDACGGRGRGRRSGGGGARRACAAHRHGCSQCCSTGQAYSVGRVRVPRRVHKAQRRSFVVAGIALLLCETVRNRLRKWWSRGFHRRALSGFLLRPKYCKPVYIR